MPALKDTHWNAVPPPDHLGSGIPGPVPAVWPPLTATELSATCRLGREPIYVGRAREQARKALCEWGLGEHTDLAELIVSELVTNALCHGDGPVEMRLCYAGDDLRVEVHDGGTGRPVRQYAAVEDECGRGVELLDGLIELHDGERGVIDDHVGPGKTVYVELLLPTNPAGAL